VGAQVSNDLIARVIGLYPGRFAGVCQLPQSPGVPVERCVAELRRCVLQLGFELNARRVYPRLDVVLEGGT
jgi:4-oxalmesaconate hydratase